jgi:putative endonuclease
MKQWLTKLLGNRGERFAARYLRRQGFRILSRQHTSRLGEIDLIALNGDTIVFVDVKTHRTDVAGRPEEAVDHAKQKQLTRLALVYLKRHGLLERRARFDVISLLWLDGSRQPDVCHLRNAFSPVGVGQMFS